MRALERLIKAKFGNKKQFYEQLGASSQTFNNWRKRGIPASQIINVADLLQLDPKALQRGEIAPAFGVGELAGRYSNTHAGPDTRGYVPLISWVHAGTWNEAEDPHEIGNGEDWLPCPTSHGLHSYALRVAGDSMTAPHGRSYPDGAIIYVDPDQRGGVVSGDRVIAKINGENQVTFKVFVEDSGRRFLKPLNPSYPIISDEFRILGKIIGTWIPE